MSTNIDTSDGTWRQVTEREWADAAGDSLRVVNGNLTSWWLRVREVPALPTAPYTVIRVVWKKYMQPEMKSDVLTLNDDRYWKVSGQDYAWWHQNVLTAITSFEIVSEPRAVTARAVLDRAVEVVRSIAPIGMELRPDGSEDREAAAYVSGLGDAFGAVRDLAREFGVES